MSCEKCWRDANTRASGGGAAADHYESLLIERRNQPCTAEEQCGDIHAPFWADGKCLCGHNRKSVKVSVSQERD